MRYPQPVVSLASDKLIREINFQYVKKKPKELAQRVTLIPYTHSTSHRLKKVALKFKDNVTFSAKGKLKKTSEVVRKHGQRFVHCMLYVYYIPFSCGFKYIRPTKQYLNIRLREHYSSVKVIVVWRITIQERPRMC